MSGSDNLNREKLRRLARHAADAGEAPSVEELSERQIQELLYEFGVYQNELLAQNEELKQLQHDLELSRNRFSDLFNLAPVGYLTVTSELVVHRANVAAARILNSTPEGLVGAKLLTFLAPEFHHSIRRELSEALERGEPTRFETPTARDPDGRRKHLIVELQPGKADSLRDDQCLMVIMDITGRKEMERNLEEARQIADEQSRAKSVFISVMSHEIRNPMTAVFGMLNLLEREELSPQGRDYLEAARSSAGSLFTTLNDTLDLSRIGARKLNLHKEPFEPRRMLEQVGLEYAKLSDEKGVALRVRVDESVEGPVLGDENRFRQVITNLANNAFKFTDEGEIGIEATQEASEDPARIILTVTVQDTGPGIPTDKLESFLRPFVQSESSYSKKAAGAGLGLSVVSELVALMGGRFSLENRTDGNGLRATIAMPFTTAEPSSLTESEPPADPGEADKTGYHLLVVEDNSIVRMALVEEMKRHGHTVILAGDGSEALDALDRQKVDAILMDVQMPGMDGVACTKRIRDGDTHASADIPIIGSTGYGVAEEQERFIAAGMSAVITKPIAMDDLQMELDRLVTR